jgi:hypothetical protein
MNAHPSSPRTRGSLFCGAAIPSVVLAGALFTLVIPAAVANPVPMPAPATPTPAPATEAVCPVGMGGLAARLRSEGMSGQAANVATQLTYQDCLDIQRSLT